MKFLITMMVSLSVFAAVPRVIYGEDNRQDVYAVEDQFLRELALSTAAMIPANALQLQDNGNYRYSYDSMGTQGFCSTERFFDQPMAGMCSGFLVGGDQLVTAGHCIRGQYDCDRYVWVFGFEMQDAQTIAFEFRPDQIFTCAEILEQKFNSSDDYALLRLNRETNLPALEYRLDGEIEVGEELVVIGHPMGLPTKITDGAWVRSNSNPFYFEANLDTYGGNSGSAVFNMETGIVEGILVRGETDFRYNSTNACYESNVCDDDGCRGEDVTRITNIEML